MPAAAPQATRGRGFRESAKEGAEHGGELHHGTFAADGAAGGNGDERGEAFHHGGADADNAVAEDDSFHEVGRFAGLAPALAEEQHGAREHAAERGHEDAAPPREGGGGFVERSAFAEEELLQRAERLAERDGRARAGNADGDGPRVGRFPDVAGDFFGDPDAEPKELHYDAAQELPCGRDGGSSWCQVSPGRGTHCGSGMSLEALRASDDVKHQRVTGGGISPPSVSLSNAARRRPANASCRRARSCDCTT